MVVDVDLAPVRVSERVELKRAIDAGDSAKVIGEVAIQRAGGVGGDGEAAAITGLEAGIHAQNRQRVELMLACSRITVPRFTNGLSNVAVPSIRKICISGIIEREKKPARCR